jgi:hypothetical protein
MKRRAAHAQPVAACLSFLALTLAAAAARAQQPPAAAPGPPPPAYEDRYIDGGALKPDISLGDYGTSDTSGLARSIRIDAVASLLQDEGANAGRDVHENGVILNAQWDTASYGAWSLDASGRFGADDNRGFSGTSNGSLVLHERGMPFDGGWRTDNALGDIYAPLIQLAALQTRFLLAPGPMLGAETQWYGPAGLQLVAGGGEPGIFEGIKVPGFQTLGGSTATLGAQWIPASHWAVGGQFTAARDVAPFEVILGPGLPIDSFQNQRLDSNTGFVTAAYSDNTNRLQLNLIDGTLDGNSNAFGVWADAAHARGGLAQNFGLFHIDPYLAWGNQLITSDVQGGYYRVGYQSRRWLADFGVDEVKSVSGNGPNTTFVNADTRYQLSRDTGIGGVVNWRYSEGQSEKDTAWSVEGYLDSVNGFGTGRVQADYATAAGSYDATLTLQQSWNMQVGTRLATTAAVDRVRTALPYNYYQDATIVRLAAYGGGDLSARLSLDGSIQWATAVSGHAAPNTSADINLNWQISHAWSLIGSYYENRIGSWTPLTVNSPLAPPTETLIPSQGQRGVFLTVRWQEARGAHFVPLGGVAGSGAGRLSGVIYLDANENGRFDAGEAGAANVTVILDGRFSVRTDANGRFDFPAIVAGRHVLTIQTDNLPLPWTVSDGGRTEVNVGTRDRVEINIGAVRLK